MNYSIWSADLAQYSNNAIKPSLEKRYGFNSLPHDFLVDKAESLAQENSLFIDKVADKSLVNAFEVWAGAVSGNIIGGNEEAAIEAGAKFQPDWDYISDHSINGSPEQREDLGNYNYGATGYLLFMRLFTEVGISNYNADFITRYILRSGGGAFQFVQDFDFKTLSYKTKLDRTWYGEEVKDVSRIEAGMDFGAFILMSKSAEKLGVKLDPKDFGFSNQAILPVDLTINEKWKEDIEKWREEIEKWKEDIEEDFRRREQENKQRQFTEPIEGDFLRNNIFTR